MSPRPPLVLGCVRILSGGAEERLRVATGRVNLLRQQLDALKAAERGILEREEKMRALKR